MQSICSAPDKDRAPIKSSMTARLLAGLVFTLAAPAAAQDLLAAQPTRSAVVANGAGLSSAVAQWNAIRQSDALPFSSYADFLIAHPGWPNEAALRKNAERALQPDAASPTTVIAFFTRYPPLTPGSSLRLAEAYASLGQRDSANAAARQAWAGGALSSEDEARLLSRFGTVLSPDDHDLRMDRLLWQRATTIAARQLPLTSPVRQPVYGTRLALLTKAPDAASRLALAADRARGDTGLFADRITWLRLTGQEGTARMLLSAPRQLSVPPLDPAKWLDMLYAIAKNASAQGQSQQAFDIARQVDDAYPAGMAVRDRPIGERDTYTNLTWLAGTTALNRLSRPADAVGLFDRYARAARSPQTISKGLYWAGRAAQAAGRSAEANSFYQRAAAYFDQFYGQLATERLGLALAIPATTRTIEISATERDAFNKREIVRVAEMLGQQGDWANQSLFIRTIAAAATSDADHALAIDLSRRIARPDLAVMAGRSAGINGLRDYIRAGFPTVPIAEQNHDTWTMIHAIARQESQFDRKIVSRAGARGLMQLMPGTARETAGFIGVGYSPSSLDDPQYNIQLGSWYFGRLMDRYQGSYPLAVAAYNAGPGNVNKWLNANGDPRTTGDILGWIEAIPLTETRGYVQRVLENAVVYDLLNPKGGQPRQNPLSTYLGKRQAG
jgi:soluble lytic murein transglycosylase